MLADIGFVGVHVGPAVDTFGGAGGEAQARAFQVYGHAFIAVKPVMPAVVTMPRIGAAAVLDAPGEVCATLTPRIKAALSRLGDGDVLEVHTHDPAARVGVPAWCRLTGNQLVAVIDDGPQRTTIYICKGLLR